MEMNLEVFMGNNLKITSEITAKIMQETLNGENKIANAVIYTALTYSTSEVVVIDPAKLITFGGDEWKVEDIKAALEVIKEYRVRLTDDEAKSKIELPVASLLFFKESDGGLNVGVVLNPVYQRLYSLWQE